MSGAQMFYVPGVEIIPGYRLQKFLGQGGFGQVWQAEAPGGTEVAIKILSLENTQGLKELRAIQLMKRMRHPNLVPIMAIWVRDDRGHILDNAEMERLSSGEPLTARPAELILAMGLGDKNLKQRLQECRAQALEGIPPEELLRYMEEAAKAIDYLNDPQRSILHRDIKPQNIMIVGDAVQVCDYGLARVVTAAARSTAAWGTPAYEAPEALAGQPAASSDQYSLAITYVELRTGYLPFKGETPAAIVYEQSRGILDLSRLPEAERPIIRRATALDPLARYPTCTAMVYDLKRAILGIEAGLSTVGSALPSRVSSSAGAKPETGFDLAKTPDSGQTRRFFAAAQAQTPKPASAEHVPAAVTPESGKETPLSGDQSQREMTETLPPRKPSGIGMEAAQPQPAYVPWSGESPGPARPNWVYLLPAGALATLILIGALYYFRPAPDVVSPSKSSPPSTPTVASTSGTQPGTGDKHEQQGTKDGSRDVIPPRPPPISGREFVRLVRLPTDLVTLWGKQSLQGIGSICERVAGDPRLSRLQDAQEGLLIVTGLYMAVYPPGDTLLLRLTRAQCLRQTRRFEQARAELQKAQRLVNTPRERMELMRAQAAIAADDPRATDEELAQLAGRLALAARTDDELARLYAHVLLQRVERYWILRFDERSALPLAKECLALDRRHVHVTLLAFGAEVFLHNKHDPGVGLAAAEEALRLQNTGYPAYVSALYSAEAGKWAEAAQYLMAAWSAGSSSGTEWLTETRKRRARDVLARAITGAVSPDSRAFFATLDVPADQVARWWTLYTGLSSDSGRGEPEPTLINLIGQLARYHSNDPTHTKAGREWLEKISIGDLASFRSDAPALYRTVLLEKARLSVGSARNKQALAAYHSILTSYPQGRAQEANDHLYREVLAPADKLIAEAVAKGSGSIAVESLRDLSIASGAYLWHKKKKAEAYERFLRALQIIRASLPDAGILDPNMTDHQLVKTLQAIRTVGLNVDEEQDLFKRYWDWVEKPHKKDLPLLLKELESYTTHTVLVQRDCRQERSRWLQVLNTIEQLADDSAISVQAHISAVGINRIILANKWQPADPELTDKVDLFYRKMLEAVYRDLLLKETYRWAGAGKYARDLVQAYKKSGVEEFVEKAKKLEEALEQYDRTVPEERKIGRSSAPIRG